MIRGHLVIAAAILLAAWYHAAPAWREADRKEYYLEECMVQLANGKRQHHELMMLCNKMWERA